MQLIYRGHSWRDRRLTLPCLCISVELREVNVETHDCYSVGMEYAVVGEVGDELCVAEAAASPGHVVS